jgi:hypothetical protein
MITPPALNLTGNAKENNENMHVIRIQMKRTVGSPGRRGQKADNLTLTPKMFGHRRTVPYVMDILRRRLDAAPFHISCQYLTNPYVPSQCVHILMVERSPPAGCERVISR